MSKGTTSYKIQDENALYFLTFSTVEWIDVFTNKKYRDIVVKSLEYCISEKGLELCSWVIMSNHIHLVARAKEGFKMTAILRDMKKFTSKQILKEIQEGSESRRDWLLLVMKKSATQNSKQQNYQLWRNDNHPIVLYSNAVIQQKINYIHQNPVEAGLVFNPEDYVYSSAVDYSGETGLLPVIMF
ncbi:REP-associated tyrosine transposase [Tenacibaculum ovolyticum]|uniref:REP-associated tyrosine transposase n=1 Tax=Tenacibaculum ovolyticum TaxID=104270 RepID=UPI0007ECDF9D|nr:transposase [Tenacibaculum ovolyticum]